MTKRHDNMLEAFRESSRIDETKPAPQPRAGKALEFPGTPIEKLQGAPAARPQEADADPVPEVPRSGGPRRPAGSEELVGVTGVPAGPKAAPPPPKERGTRITLPVGREWFFGIASLALTLAFLLGRWSAGVVSAASNGSPEAHGARADARDGEAARQGGFQELQAPGSVRDRSVGSGGQTPASGTPAREQVALTAAGRAFLDPTNQYTIVAITYDDTEAGREFAIATYRHLEEKGFDVVYPRRKSGSLLIFVGASPGYRDLESVEGRLRATLGPNGKLPFAGAYRVNIDDYR